MFNNETQHKAKFLTKIISLVYIYDCMKKHNLLYDHIDNKYARRVSKIIKKYLYNVSI